MKVALFLQISGSFEPIYPSSIHCGGQRPVLLPVHVEQPRRVPEGGVLEAVPQRLRRRHLPERHQQAL